MADRVGQQFGNYRLTRLLGQGGFADVYLGEHIHLGTEAAIKVLYTKLERDTIEIKRFRDEARTVARLLHPNIVRILDFGIEDITPFLVMDYAPNGTLRDRYPKETRVPLDLVVGYVNQVAQALQYAHEQGLIHQDVKPANMLLDHKDNILLSDFGIATIVSNDDSGKLATQENLIGTAAYMAPEHIEGKPRRASDQYALGIVVYEWLTGDKPFHGSFVEIATGRLLALPPSLEEKIPEISPAINQVVMKALARKPDDRFATILDFAHALEQAVKERTITREADSSTVGVPVTPYDAQGTIGTRFDVKPGQTLAMPDEWEYTQDNVTIPRLPPPPPPYSINDENEIAQRGYPQHDPTIPSSPYSTDENEIAQLMQDGEKFYKARLYEHALEVYKRIIAYNPRNVAAHGYKGNTLGKLQFYREALSAYEAALNIEAHHVSIWNSKGDILVKLGNYEEAIIAYEEALKISPKDVLTWSAKASVFVRLKRYEEAVNAYKECLDFNSLDASIWAARGNILAKLQRNEEALADYDAALKLDPRNGAVCEAKGKLLVEIQCYEEALDAYTKAIALLPNRTAVRVRVARSDILARLGRYDEALADCEHAQILSPKDRVIEKQCTMLRTLKQQKEALAQATQIVTPPPPDDQAKTTIFPLNTMQFDQTKVQEGQRGYTKQANRSKQSSDNITDTKRFHVFLSHAPEDVDLVKELAERLEDQHSFRVWIGEWMQIPGTSWQQAIKEGLQQSHCCAVCIGAQTPIGWFKREMEWALAQQSNLEQASAKQQSGSFRVIPVLLSNASQAIENEIDDFLKLNTFVNFRDWEYGYAFHVLTQGVKGEPIGRWSPKDSTSMQTGSFAEDKLRELHGWVKEDIVDKSLSIKLQETILIQYWLPNDDTEGKGK